MLCLRTFGGLGIERGGQPLSSHGPRRRLLALLALIAGHDAPGISRDKLLAYLWPDKETRHARNSLKQALYSLRQSPGIPLVTCAGGALRLDRRFIQVDLWQFETALEQADEQAAVELYRGPYLDGFYVSGLFEFERWVEAERQRLRHHYADALRVLAERAEWSGNQAGAVEWWRRLTAAEPLCSTAALGLMRALAAAGDSTAAREHARIHAAYVRAELGGPVSEEVVAFANRLRTEPVPRERPPLTATSGSSARISRILRGSDRRTGEVAVPVAAVARSSRVFSWPEVPRVAWRATAAFWAVILLLIAFRHLG
jgi:DNA-binding SARP family transcriptional activator